jgi:RNA polymerase sigma-70 factor (ECF subfamily)
VDAQRDFADLYAAHAPRVLAFCLRRTTRDFAEDALAETFAVAWRRRDDLPREPLPWLLGVARKVLANQRRAASRRQALAQRLAAVPPIAPADTVGPPVVEALETLSAADREVLMLTAWDGLSAAEAATVLGCSPLAVRLRLSRARKKLRDALAELDARAQPPSSDIRLPAKEVSR